MGERLCISCGFIKKIHGNNLCSKCYQKQPLIKSYKKEWALENKEKISEKNKNYTQLHKQEKKEYDNSKSKFLFFAD
jgi:hypothetical protein